MANHTGNEDVVDDVTSDSEAVVAEAAERFDYVRFTFADFNGTARSKSVARRNFKEFFAQGINVFCGKYNMITSVLY